MIQMLNESVALMQSVQRTERANIVMHRAVKAMRFQVLVTIALWSIFPITFMAGNAGLISNRTQEVLFCFFNFFSKTLFANCTIAANFLTVDATTQFDRITDVGEPLAAGSAAAAVNCCRRRCLPDRCLPAALSTSEYVIEQEAFLNSVSQELRAPLDGIIGLSETLMQSDGLDAKQKKFLRLIRTSGTNLLNLISDILDVLSFRGGEIKLQFEDVDVAEVINQVVSVLTPLTASGVSLRGELLGETRGLCLLQPPDPPRRTRRLGSAPLERPLTPVPFPLLPCRPRIHAPCGGRSQPCGPDPDQPGRERPQVHQGRLGDRFGPLRERGGRRCDLGGGHGHWHPERQDPVDLQRVRAG